ncbi:MAG: flagellar hook-basal body complex protein FliE [Deltaproteobacteria bacterium]|nr:flagellar hook-basal body complex protein FliE [Deltaproteobacteria bacterium]
MKIENLTNLNTELGIGQFLEAPKNNLLGEEGLQGESFKDLLMKGIEKVNADLLKSSNMAQEHLANGKHDLHEVMIQMETADLHFRFMTQVRNKVLEAYNEIMRMQV